MSRRPPRPDLDPGDRVLIAAHHWQDTPAGRRMGLPNGQYRWRVVDRVVFDIWMGWTIRTTPTRGDHPSRENANHVVSVVRAGGEHRPEPAPPPQPVQLDLFATT